MTDTFIRSAKQRANMARRTRSNGDGRYVLSGLERDAEYLVIAIVPPREDSEEYFLDKTTGKLTAETTILNLWAEDTPKDQCHP
jgi:hypothetical protein